MDVDPPTTSSVAKNAPLALDTSQKPQKTPTGKVLNRQNQKRTLWKNAFDSPFTVTWFVALFSLLLLLFSISLFLTRTLLCLQESYCI